MAQGLSGFAGLLGNSVPGLRAIDQAFQQQAEVYRRQVLESAQRGWPQSVDDYQRKITLPKAEKMKPAEPKSFRERLRAEIEDWLPELR